MTAPAPMIRRRPALLPAEGARRAVTAAVFGVLTATASTLTATTALAAMPAASAAPDAGKAATAADGVMIWPSAAPSSYLTAPKGAATGSANFAVNALPVKPPKLPGLPPLGGIPAVPLAAMIELPVEVLFATTGNLPHAVPIIDAAVATSPVTMSLRVYVETDDIGYVEVNGQRFRLANRDLVFAQPRRLAFGGFGGGYSVFDVSRTLPAGTVRPGPNLVTFGKDKVDADHLGFRVLAFNFHRGSDTTGTPLIAADRFTQAEPQSLAGLDTGAATIEAGRRLWSEAALRNSPLTTSSIRARCGDCHTASGYDLHYFGYSNRSIVQRAQFHGLSEAQGKQLASYIRTLPAPAPTMGRPWNAPYQPGPGLSSRPLREWAAGAGSTAVVADDAATFAAAFPRGIPKAHDFKGARLDLTDVPVSLELPVWNQWLPRIHPKEDASLGVAVTTTRFYQRLVGLPTQLAPQAGRLVGLQAFTGATNELGHLYASEVGSNAASAARIHRDAAGNPTAQANERDDIAAYSLRQWRLVKEWEAAQLNDLQGLGRELAASDARYPRSMPARAFLSNAAFQTAPHLAKLKPITLNTPPGTGNGLRDAQVQNWGYFSLAWYYLQMLQADNFQQGDGATHWPYMTAFSSLGSSTGADRYDFPAVRLLTTLKSVEAFALKAPGGVKDRVGFNNGNGYLKFLGEQLRGPMKSIAPAQKAAVINAVLGGFVNLARSYPAKSLNTINIYEDSRCGTKLRLNPDSGCTSAQIYWLPFELRGVPGVDPKVLDALAATYAPVWPAFDWQCVRDARPIAECQERNRKRGLLF